MEQTIQEGDLEAAKHEAVIKQTQDKFLQDDEDLQGSAVTFRVARTYGGRKKVICNVNCAMECKSAIRWLLSESGAVNKKGRPPMTGLERVIQGVLLDAEL